MKFQPIALILAVLPSSIACVAFLNPWGAAAAIVAWLVCAAATRHIRTLWSPIIGVILLGSLTAGISMALYGRPSGALIWQFGPAHVTEGSVHIAWATALRIIAIAVPSVLVFRSLDVTRVADALESNLRLPPRIVWSLFAGLRQLELARADWQTVRMAQRARGVESRFGPVRVSNALIGLFTLALERGAELAVTLDTRGLSAKRRVPSRSEPWQRRDVLVIVVGCLIGVAVSLVALITGGNRV